MKEAYGFIATIEETLANDFRYSITHICNALDSRLADVNNAQAQFLFDKLTGVKWTAAFINDLPDSSFAVIENGGSQDEDGKTIPRNFRHLPFKDASGKVDLPHLRNALVRMNQIKSVSEQDSTERIRTHAKNTLILVARKQFPAVQLKQNSQCRTNAVSQGRYELTTEPAGPDNHTHITGMRWDEHTLSFVGHTISTQGDTDHIHKIAWRIPEDQLFLANAKELTFMTGHGPDGHTHNVVVKFAGGVMHPTEPDIEAGATIDRNLVEEGLQNGQGLRPKTVVNNSSAAEVELQRILEQQIIEKI
jgi:hypothetical protein